MYSAIFWLVLSVAFVSATWGVPGLIFGALGMVAYFVLGAIWFLCMMMDGNRGGNR